MVVESAKHSIVEQCLPMGPMMVLYQYLNRQLISNDYLFSSVYTFGYSKQLLLLLQSSTVARYLLIVNNVGIFLQINTQICPKKENSSVQ